MKEKQRLALEAHMVTQRTEAGKTQALCDMAPGNEKQPVGRQQNCGIFKSACAGHVYGYYAKAGFRNLFFVTRIHRNFAEAVQDHIILSRMLEEIRRDCLQKDFPAAVKTVVEAVLGEEGISQHRFLRYYSVNFPATPWVGRPLFVQSHELHGALEVWKLFRDAKDLKVFSAGQQNACDIEKKADERWKKMREIFVALQAAQGKLHQSQLGRAFQEFEVRRRRVVQRMIALWRRQHAQQQRKAKVAARNKEEMLLRRFEQLRRQWERSELKEAERKKKKEAQEIRKRRWDGKESLKEFERRVRCQTRR